MAFNAAIGCHKADSSFNLFKQKKLLYSLPNIFVKYDDPSATAGQFLLCFYLLSYKPCLNCLPFGDMRGVIGFHQEVDRKKHRAAASVVLETPHRDLTSPGSSYVRFIPTEMIVCIISLLTTFTIRLH